MTLIDPKAVDRDTVDVTTGTDGGHAGAGRRDEAKPAAHFDADHCVLWLGNVPVPVRPGQHSNADVLTLIAATVRDLRGLGDDQPCHLRNQELATFARLLDLEHRALRIDVRRTLGLSKSEAGTLVGQLKEALRRN